ncbi:MAG: TRAP transporter small permease [bacterium]|jgi:TRAP-type C4-dicarboxylate transport system permease small subunit
MHRASELIDRYTSYAAFVLMTVMTIVIAIQVFYRYVLSSSLSWSEELARYLFIWTVMLMASSGVKHGFHVAITFIRDKLPIKMQNIFALLGSILMFAFAVVLVVFGIRLAWATRIQLSPAMRLSMFWVYLSVPVSGCLIVIHESDRLLRIFSHLLGLHKVGG